jgi:hypothetical protein
VGGRERDRLARKYRISVVWFYFDIISVRRDMQYGVIYNDINNLYIRRHNIILTAQSQILA